VGAGTGVGVGFKGIALFGAEPVDALLGILDPVWRIAVIVFGLGFIIFIHELGHFMMAKKNGVRVEAFSLGFGPVIWSRTKGDTEYRLSIIPLGGYVKMTGEMIGDEVKGEPHELTSKTAWQRFQIFVAGALMNLILAFPLCIIAFGVGIWVPSSEVASVPAEEWRAGMRPGDRILEVNGENVADRGGEIYKLILAGESRGSKVPVKILQNGQEKTIDVVVAGVQAHELHPRSTMITEVVEGSPLWESGLRAMDVILSINDKTIYNGGKLQTLLEASPNASLNIRYRRWNRDENAWKEGTAEFVMPSLPGYPYEEGMIVMEVGSLREQHPREGDLIAGDQVTSVNGRPVWSFVELTQALREAGEGKVDLGVLRDGKDVSLKDWDTTLDRDGKVLVGFSPRLSKYVGTVKEGSFYHQAGLRTGDELVRIGGPGEAKILDIFQNNESDLEVTVARMEGGERKEVNLNLQIGKVGDLKSAGFGVVTDPKTGQDHLKITYDGQVQQWTFGEAVKNGIKEPWIITKITYLLLYKLLTGAESAKGLAGPVGIFKVTYDTVERGAGKFLWILALITVNLGIFNLLPVPVLDGGHIVLLVIEKIKGSPPSEKFIIGFQYAGLFLLLALILLVTYNDITNLF
jgi:regulator of sigma E protease